MEPYLARWNGTSWSGVASAINNPVDALAVFDDGLGASLFAGGFFLISAAGDSYLAELGCAIASLPGCAGNPATLTSPAAGVPLGAPLSLEITGLAAASGLGLVHAGKSGLDAKGCRLLLPGFGELLLGLAPLPVLVASAPLAGGTCAVAPLVPLLPSLKGLTALLQGAAIDPMQPQPIEMTNALAVHLGS